jgi:AraC family transcriptional regulator
MLVPQILQKPVMTIVGLETPFIHGLSPETNNFKVIPPLWDAFCKRMEEVPGRIGHASYGIIYSRPEEQRSHPHELQYIAGAQVRSGTAVPDGMVSRTIPAGTFAVFLHRGPIQKIGETCYEIYRVWLPQSKWQHADIADVEVYDEQFDCEGENSELEYWISVIPR